MARSSFEQALSRLLKDEGGYSDHPSDTGGPTNFGITIRDARQYWKPAATAADMRVLPISVAKQIYRARYWDALRCDELPAGLDYAVFDYGVNSGVGRAGKVLRRLLKMRDRPGAITDDVLSACAAADAADLVDLICAERLRFLRSLNTWPVFGRGWERRVAGVRAASLLMAGQALPLQRRAKRARAKTTLNIPTRAAASTAVVTVGGAAAFQATSVTAVWITLALALLALAATLAFLCWRDTRRPEWSGAEHEPEDDVDGMG